MTYRELLELYKTGKLDAETQKALEQDIEKQDAISEYLFEEASIPELEELSPGPDSACSEQDNTLALIQKAIRRAFIKTGTIVGAVVLTLVLTVLFVLPGVVDLFYYRADKSLGTDHAGNDVPQFSQDLAVCTELFLPGKCRNFSVVRSEGWGRYNITIPQILASSDGSFSTVIGELDKNKLTLYDPNFLNLPAFNAFRLPKEYAGPTYCEFPLTGEFLGAAGTWGEMYDALDNLVENQKYRAYISFSDLSTIDDIWPLLNHYLYRETWCGVFAGDENGQLIAPNIGFNLCPGGALLESLGELAEKYPSLSLITLTEDGLTSFTNDPAQYEQHFISLLSYLRDRPELIDLFGFDAFSVGSGRYDEIIESVQQNGLLIYGFSAELTKEELLELRDDPHISYIYTTPLH